MKKEPELYTRCKYILLIGILLSFTGTMMLGFSGDAVPTLNSDEETNEHFRIKGLMDRWGWFLLSLGFLLEAIAVGIMIKHQY